MITSKYISALKSSSKYPQLAGSTPTFPKELIDLLGCEPTTEESQNHSSRKRIIAEIRRLHRGGEINLCMGTSGAFFQSALALFEVGSIAVIEVPYYEPYLAALKEIGFKIRLWRRTGYADEDLKTLSKWKSKRTILVMSSPHFFHGWQLNRNQIDSLAEGFGGVILDEVFRPQFNSNHEFSVRPTTNNIVCVNGLSKSLGLSNLRIGWTSSNGRIGKAIRSIGHLIQTETPTYSQIIALQALLKRTLIIETIKRQRSLNRKWLIDNVRSKFILSHDFAEGHFGSVKRKSESALDSSVFGVKGYSRFRIDTDVYLLKKFFGINDDQ